MTTLITIAVAGWLAALVASFIAYKTAKALAEVQTPIILEHEDQPTERAPSPARYLFACSKRLGVSTQTLKDLGFKPHQNPDGSFSLTAPTVVPEIEKRAREAMLEIAAEARGPGGRATFPPTSWRWIAKAIVKS